MLHCQRALNHDETMKQHYRFTKTFFLSVFTLLFLLSGCASTQSDNKYTFTSSDSPLDDVITAQSLAAKQNKLLLVVLGAQWCHDSTGLAKRFSSKEMQRILTPHYQTVFVDVGMLEDRRAITNRFNYPIYYATPTVMIVDPSSSALLNRASMDIWGKADSIPLAQYVDYFSAFANMSAKQKAPMIAWQSTPQEAQYYAEQAVRLQEAYDALNPMLLRDINGDTPDGFYKLWKETKAFRTELQETMTKRAALALEMKGDGSDEATAAPALRHYHPFSWEAN